MYPNLHRTRLWGVHAAGRPSSAQWLAASSPDTDTATAPMPPAGSCAFTVQRDTRVSMWRDQHVIVAVDGAVYEPAPDGAISDARLFAELYAQRGFFDALRAINADVAVALFDSRTRELWLGRDRLGVRPLYYVAAPELFAFASRPRPLLRLDAVSGEPNSRTVALVAGSHYRYFDNAPGESPYAGVSQLPAAHILRLAGDRITVQRYWSLSEAPDLTDPEGALAERYRDLLADAVRIRLCRTPRAAFTLSGGMDSSSVLATATRVTGDRQPAMSVVYEDRTYDESADIEDMLDGPVSEWVPIEVATPNVFELVAEMIEAHDEPVATATWLSHFVLCREAARRGFDYLYGGLGGDELNAGEYEHFFYFFADLRAAGDGDRLDAEISAWARHHDHPIYRKGPAVVDEALPRLVDLDRPGRCLADRRRLLRYAGALRRDYFDLERFEPVMKSPFTSYLKSRTYQDLTRETIPCCLRAEDRGAAAFGLDVVLPFLDYRLVEFAFRLPGTLKFRGGVAKHLLREAMKGTLPEPTRTRIKKTGWNAPAHVWFSGRGREALLDLVHSRAFQQRGIYDVPEVLRLLDEHERIVVGGERRDNHMMFFWQLLNVELWHRSLESFRQAVGNV